jgi:hypothetical protein
MGANCFLAGMLDALGLRMFSGPYDWVNGSTFEMRFRLFLNRFDKYFEKGDLQFQGHAECTDVYRNQRTGLAYIHDFKLNSDFDAAYPEVRAKYDRRIARVLDKIKNGRRTLILYTETVGATQTLEIGRLVELVKEANAMYKSEIDLLYYKHNPLLFKCRGSAIKRLDEHCCFAEYYSWDRNPTDINIYYLYKNILECLQKMSRLQN